MLGLKLFPVYADHPGPDPDGARKISAPEESPEVLLGYVDPPRELLYADVVFVVHTGNIRYYATQVNLKHCHATACFVKQLVLLDIRKKRFDNCGYWHIFGLNTVTPQYPV